MKQCVGLKTGDILLMALVALTALVLFLMPFLRQEASTAQILVAETGQVRTVALDTDALYEITAQGIHLTVQVSDGAVSVSQSDCRDGICTGTPAISRPGQSIVCAPAGVVVRITGEEALVDGVSG